MTGLTKVLLGTAVAVGVGVTIAVVAETKKEKEQKEITDGKGNVVGFQDKTGQITNKDEKDKSFIEKSNNCRGNCSGNESKNNTLDNKGHTHKHISCTDRFHYAYLKAA